MLDFVVFGAALLWRGERCYGMNMYIIVQKTILLTLRTVHSASLALIAKLLPTKKRCVVFYIFMLGYRSYASFTFHLCTLVILTSLVFDACMDNQIHMLILSCLPGLCSTKSIFFISFQ